METDDQGRQILPPIVYEPVIEDGRRIGFRVPEAERAMWDRLSEQREKNLGVYSKTGGKVRRIEALELSALVAELEPWILDFNDGLRRDMELAYARDAVQLTKVVMSILQGCEAQRIHSPGGVLRTRLGDLREQADLLG